MKYISVYVATCALNGKQYVGITRQKLQARRTRHWQDARRGAKTAFASAIRKHGKASFSFEHVACAATWDDACEVEQRLIRTMGTLAPGGYNLSQGGQGEPNKFITPEHRAASVAALRAYWKTHKPSPESIEAGAAAKRGRKYTAEHRAAISAGTKMAMQDQGGRDKIAAGVRASFDANPERRARLAEIMKASPERVEKMVAANRGRKQSPEEVARRVGANTGKKRTPEQRERIAASMRGRKMSEAQKAKISAIQTGRPIQESTKIKLSAALKGRPKSEETRRKMSEARKGMSFTAEHRANIAAANRRRYAAQTGECHVGA